MTLRFTIVASTVAACLMSAGAPAYAQTTVTPSASDSTALFHRFTIPARVAWGAISIDIAPGGWRVGSLDGPVADQAQLRAVLSRLTMLEIGGRCAGWVDKHTYYPCGFAIRDLDLGGTVEQRFSALTTDWGEGSEDARRDAAAERPTLPDLSAYGLISPVLDAERFVSLRAPSRYLGDKSQALGARMKFEFRAVTNMLVPSQFDRANGAVVLRAGPQRDDSHRAARGVQS